jgi:3-phenylpropionate/trans-cinnamate dioxygenase ferredoxin component
MSNLSATSFVPVCKISDVPEGGRLVVEVDERFVALFHVDGRFYAVDDRCSHDGGPLGDGQLEGFVVVCPRHGAKFDIRTGQVLSMPATRDIAAYEVRIEGEDVLVGVNGG